MDMIAFTDSKGRSTREGLRNAEIVSEDIQCFHSGISPKLYKFDNFEDFLNVKNLIGEIADLLWSDPSNNFKISKSTK